MKRVLSGIAVLLSLALLLLLNVRLHRPGGAPTVHAQLRYLEGAMAGGAATGMQGLFPEGYVFTWALYGLASAQAAGRLGPQDERRAHLLAEARRALAAVHSEEALSIFDAGMDPPHGGGANSAASDRATAVAETVYHRERFLRESREPAAEVDMRVLTARIEADLHDVRGSDDPALHDPADHGAGRALASRLRAAGSWGVHYRSVQRPIGECVAVFRPRAISRCHQTPQLAYLWDGERIVHVVEK